MCYEISLTKTEQQVEDEFDAEMYIQLLYEPIYHVSGFTHPHLMCIPMEEPTNIFPMEWGLVPPSSETDILNFRRKYNTLNAKSETIFESKIYSEPILNKRCLVIADGFYEPNHKNGVVTPYYCYLEGHKIFTFAGIYSGSDNEEENWTVSILTTKANPFFAKIHNIKKRMPLVLDKEFEKVWLDPSLNEKNLKELMKHGFTKDKFKAHSVTRDLYQKEINTNKRRIIEKVDYNEPDLFNN